MLKFCTGCLRLDVLLPNPGPPKLAQNVSEMLQAPPIDLPRPSQRASKLCLNLKLMLDLKLSLDLRLVWDLK